MGTQRSSPTANALTLLRHAQQALDAATAAVAALPKQPGVPAVEDESLTEKARRLKAESADLWDRRDQAIAEALMSYMTQREIAHLFEVSVGTVSNVSGALKLRDEIVSHGRKPPAL